MSLYLLSKSNSRNCNRLPNRAHQLPICGSQASAGSGASASVGDEKRREGMSKGMPPNFLVDPGPQCRRANDLLQQGIWPKRMLPPITGTREYPVVGLPITGGLLPQPEVRGYALIQRHRLAGCFRLTIPNMSQI